MSDTGERKSGLLKESPAMPAPETEAQTHALAPVQIHPDQFYRTLVEQSMGLICAHDFDGTLLYVNPAAVRALGYPMDAWIGKSLRNFLAPSFQPFFAVYLQRIRQQRADEGFMRVVTVTGEYRLWRYHNVWYEEETRPLYVIGCAQDVTEEIRLERELRKTHDELEQRVQERTAELMHTNIALGESEARYRGLFENANDVIATLTVDGTFTSINRAAEVLLGWSRTELIGQHVRVVTTPASALLVEEWTRQFLIGEKLTSNLEIEVVRKSGSVVLLECRTRAMYDKDGNLTGVQGIFRDITERKRAEEQLRLAKEAAENADHAKSEFLAVMNHELRTPLSVITGYIDLFLEGTFGVVTGEQRTVLQRLQVNASGVVDLVSDVLSLNRLEGGRLSVEFVEVSIPQLLQEIETETSGVRELSGLHFTWCVDNTLTTVISDPGKLKVVIKNLLINAIKFTRAGIVTIGAQGYADGVEVYVADTGIGIALEQHKVIFDAFRQGSTTNVRGLTGVGLGLHIAKQLLDLLGGTISVTSEVGKGSTFHVRLPLPSPQAVPSQ